MAIHKVSENAPAYAAMPEALFSVNRVSSSVFESAQQNPSGIVTINNILVARGRTAKHSQSSSVLVALTAIRLQDVAAYYAVPDTASTRKSIRVLLRLENTIRHRE